jgi:hypothetical protein
LTVSEMLDIGSTLPAAGRSVAYQLIGSAASAAVPVPTAADHAAAAKRNASTGVLADPKRRR